MMRFGVVMGIECGLTGWPDELFSFSKIRTVSVGIILAIKNTMQAYKVSARLIDMQSPV